MDVLVLLWSASVFAAISFFAAGLATHAAVVRRRSAATVAAGADAHEQAARGRVTELEAGLAHAQADAAKIRAALVAAERNATAADGRAATADQRASTFEQRATALEQRAGAAEQRATAIEQRATAAEPRATAAEQRATAAEQRATVAQQRATSFEQRATSAEQRATAAEQRATALEQRATALEQRGSTLEQRATAAEQRANVLEQRASSTDGELATANARIATLDAELVAKAKPKRPPGAARTRPSVVTERRKDDTVEGSLAARLGVFADECGYEVVVLSDAQGLLLAGVGDEQVQGTIAALSSVARELTTRAAEFVELRPKLIEVTDEAGRTLRIRLFQWEQEPIALASFGIGHTEPTQEEETVITVFPTLMAAS